MATPEELKRIVLEVLASVAPEVGAVDVQTTVNFRDQVEMDSIDYLNFVLGLEQRLGVRVPESDYPKLSSLDGCLAYLGALTRDCAR